MEREVDKLSSSKKYKALIELVFFCEEGDIMTGKHIKKNIPCDVSPHLGINKFFEEVKE